MPSVSDVIRATRRRDPEPAAPPARNLRREYKDAISAFIAAKRTGTPYSAVAAAQRLRDLRDEAVAEGFGEQMARAWEEPQPHADDRWMRWYEQRLEHLLHGGPDPGPRPWQQNEWLYWSEQYADAIHTVAAAYRSGSPTARDEALGELWQTRLRTINAGFAARDAHMMGAPDAGVTPDSWEAEALFRLEHGRVSGLYHVPPPLRLFMRESELRAQDDARHSAVILLAEHDGMPVGTWVQLDPATSWELVESRRAQWARDHALPPDTRPPVEMEPETGWVAVRFLKPVRLTTRHLVGNGDVRLIAPDEGASLIRIGAAEEFIEQPPPPPPPPKPAVLFE